MKCKHHIQIQEITNIRDGRTQEKMWHVGHANELTRSLFAENTSLDQRHQEIPREVFLVDRAPCKGKPFRICERP